MLQTLQQDILEEELAGDVALLQLELELHTNKKQSSERDAFIKDRLANLLTIYPSNSSLIENARNFGIKGV